jgi:type VI secretion system secreted protein Hcp
MADGLFITVDGIPGEVTQKAHKDKIAGLSYSYAVDLPMGGGGAGDGIGKPTPSPATFSKRFDRATPKLFETLVKGKHIKFVLVEFERVVSGKPVIYHTVRFDDVLLTHIAHSASEGEFESVAFVAQKARIEHRQFNAKGAVTGTTVVEWDWKLMK